MIHGILNVRKEKGFTSHDVVAKLRGMTRQKKIGHTGTLDPDAEGVLPVCLGKATRLCEMMTDKEKGDGHAGSGWSNIERNGDKPSDESRGGGGDSFFPGEL